MIIGFCRVCFDKGEVSPINKELHIGYLTGLAEGKKHIASIGNVSVSFKNRKFRPEKAVVSVPSVYKFINFIGIEFIAFNGCDMFHKVSEVAVFRMNTDTVTPFVCKIFVREW